MPEPIVIDIWPELAPGETSAETGSIVPMYGRNVRVDITRPQLTIYPLADEIDKSPTVIILPGGGYEILADEHEGIDIAQWLNSFGFAAAILRYRIPKKRDAAFADAQRGIRVLRSRADEFGIDLKRVGVLGFSAGGHLAARLSSRYAFNGYRLVDSVDEISARPDFTLLIYPAYLIGDEGRPPDDVRPHGSQSPMFLTQTEDDHVFCAKTYADAALEAGIDTNLALYEIGGHGYGLYPDPALPVSDWPKEAEQWLKKTAKMG